MENKFLDKALYIEDKGILVIGDLHIGYDTAMMKAGILTPKTQVKELIEDLTKLFQDLERKDLKKIVFLGDIKHAFGYEFEEKILFNEVLEFLKQKFQDKDIIFIKGNHDTIDYSFKGKLKDFHIEDDIIFIHGHKEFPEMKNKEIKTIIMGHQHPAVNFYDNQTNKEERYKCFLTGKYKSKELIILPSFLEHPVGTAVNNYEHRKEFSFLPKSTMMNSTIHAIGKDKIFDFGKVKEL